MSIPPARPSARVALLAAVLTIFALVAASACLTTFPLVLSDEANYLLPTLYGYSDQNFARWGIISQIPNHLFYRLYRPLGPADIYVHAKLLNAGFVAAAAIPIYALSRAYLSPRPAVALAVVGICAPIATFARYFMPECLYYFGFWSTLYLLQATLHRSARLSAIVAGCALGLLSLVKPHALAIVAGVAIFHVLRPATWRSRVACATFVVACFYIARAAIGYALSGSLDWSVSGPTYKGILNASHLDLAELAYNAAGHLAALLILGGIPLAALLVELFRDRGATPAPVRDIALLAICVTAAMFAMTVYFSYSVHLTDPARERIGRLHGRYYAFALPLCMLAYAALLRSRRALGTVPRNRTLLAFGAATAACCLAIGRWYETSVVDYPELGILTRWPGGLVVAFGAAAVSLTVVRFMQSRTPPHDSWRSSIGLTWWAGVTVSTTVLLLAAPLVGKWFVPNAVDRAMMMDETMRSLRGRADGLVVGTSATEVETFRVMFHLASMARGRLIAPDGSLEAGSVPSDVNWLILMPGAGYAGPGSRSVAGTLTLVRLR